MDLEEQVAQGRFRHYEWRAINRLNLLLPAEEKHIAEGEVRFFALEAARLYDPGRGAQFGTFLFGHLRHRTRALLLKTRAKRRRPELGFIELTSHPVCCAAPIAEISELRASLSPATRSVFDLALQGNSIALREAFCSRYYKARVESLLGVSRKQVRDAVLELRRVIPKHITLGKEI